jgi:hypothetical protein
MVMNDNPLAPKAAAMAVMQSHDSSPPLRMRSVVYCC